MLWIAPRGVSSVGKSCPANLMVSPREASAVGKSCNDFHNGEYIREIYFSEQQRLKTFPFDLFIGIVLNYCCSALISYYFRCSFRRYGS